MHDLAPLHALGGAEARIDTVAGVTLTENMGLALASVSARKGQETACRAHLGELLEGSAPEPGKTVLHDPEASFWMAPDQWMVGAPFGTHEDLAAQLKARFCETASITEQTDAWVCFDMRGDGIEAVMQLCANIDIERMQTGDAVRTVIHYMGVYVLRRDPANWLRILGSRSSAGSLHHALVTAMKAAL
ncbi:sarcosine oxidase subunit gamma [Marivita hallyeonensis]|uniref:Sarcosine oxidase subunit gamma n=1 Tax=Marivita hallyeonensis TaxID=996342 RepID=A0A1M5TYC6_9RHOB|nr:sarcosine oxidase subunit gamma [Marivita hallyeonensis]SHH55835.1 sarcosine oxidase subunit gamma [Marivita hallyeonensis]